MNYFLHEGKVFKTKVSTHYTYGDGDEKNVEIIGNIYIPWFAWNHWKFTTGFLAGVECVNAIRGLWLIRAKFTYGRRLGFFLE